MIIFSFIYQFFAQTHFVLFRASVGSAADPSCHLIRKEGFSLINDLIKLLLCYIFGWILPLKFQLCCNVRSSL